MHFPSRELPARGASTATLFALIATAVGALCLALVADKPAVTHSATSPQSRHFPSTGHTVSGAFLSYFDRYGGVRIFGLPVSSSVTENGRPVQYFERQRFEYHKDLAGTPNEVQLSRLGAEMAPREALGKHSAPFTSTARQIYFPETRHSLSHSFLDFWKANGGLRIFGYPITEPLNENGFLVQYFERARMEYHPEKAANGFGVELGLLGKSFLAAHPEIASRLAGGSRSVAPTSRGAEPPAAPQPPPDAPLSALESDLLNRINDARKSAGAPPASLNAPLRALALSRTRDMVARGYFSHTTPEGTDFLAMIKAQGISFKYAGEILANNNYDQSETAPQAYNSFANSPRHNTIMLDARYNLVGLGEATDSRGFHYYTVIFIQQ